MIYLFKIYTFVPNIVFPLKFFSGPCNYLLWQFLLILFLPLSGCLLTEQGLPAVLYLYFSACVWSKSPVAPAISFQSCFLQIPAQGLAGHHCSLSPKALIFFLVCPELNSCVCFFMFLHMLIQFIIELTVQSHDFN